VILRKSHSPTTTGHFDVKTHLRPSPNRCIQAKRHRPRTDGVHLPRVRDEPRGSSSSLPVPTCPEDALAESRRRLSQIADAAAAQVQRTGSETTRRHLVSAGVWGLLAGGAALVRRHDSYRRRPTGGRCPRRNLVAREAIQRRTSRPGLTTTRGAPLAPVSEQGSPLLAGSRRRSSGAHWPFA
jgi:hypothetical protein